MSSHLLSKARHDREPWGIGLLARWVWKALRTPFTKFNRWRRLLRIRHGGVDHTWWWHDRIWLMILKLLTVFLALIFLAWLIRALIVVIDRSSDANEFPFGFSPDKCCNARNVECGALTRWVTSLLSIALASAVFLLWRLSRTRHSYLHTARRYPRELVPTAGTVIGKIVGRDQLCRAVMEDLRVRSTRRPHVLVGGVGTGKTAVLVQMTELLAKRHAVPVPIRLREVGELDFTDLAKKRFLDEIDERLSSASEGERTWRRLLRDGRIVVLADGLEEALSDDIKDPERKAGERDTQIRNAIREAHKRRLPLFIASRPHSPLRGMDATIHELEPLSENDALSYVTEDTPTEDDWRLSWIVDTADVAEAPLYLQVTRELSRLDMLDHIVTREDQGLQTSTHDRATLRLRVLKTWDDAIIRGRLYPEVPLDRREREITLDWISALACIGLKDDSLEVSLDISVKNTLGGNVEDELEKRSDPATAARPGRSGITGIDKQLAAAWGAQLGLVEFVGNQVRFQHSLIQAYLGSRLMDMALTEQYWKEALAVDGDTAGGPRRPRPGREFLIALVLHSRNGHGRNGHEDAALTAPSASGDQPPRISSRDVCSRLLDAAGKHYDSKALDMYAAALEIAGAPGQSGAARPPAQVEAHASVTTARAGQQRHITIQATELAFGATLPARQPGGAVPEETTSLSGIGNELKERWQEIRSGDLQTLEEAKIGLVRRFGEALRTRNEPSNGHAAVLGYAQLYDICCDEDSYRVRLAGAQEIGQGGYAAYRELQKHLAVPCTRWPSSEPEVIPPSGDEPAANKQRWARQVSAWLLPPLVTSVDPGRDHPSQDVLRRRLRETLEQWLGHVGPGSRDRYPEDERLSISAEIALAQGFKYAANQRHGQLHTRPEACSYLEAQAQEMLKYASYWFSELTLIQALTLWALPEGSEPFPARRAAADFTAAGRPRPNPDEIVERWLDIIGDKSPDQRYYHGRRPVHPFVEAAADLASRALAIQQPGRFLWMGESDVVSRVGAGQPASASTSARKPRLWIPPWLGWSALDPAAQQLLADVLLLLNLAERGDPPKNTEERLERANRHELPPCITRDRRPLEPLLTVGTEETHRPGSSCLDGCRFQLCPYPPKGRQHHRAELSEEFSRRQYRLVRHYFRFGRHTAPWQGMSAGRLRRFWTQMAERARNSAG